MMDPYITGVGLVLFCDYEKVWETSCKGLRIL